MRYLCQNAYMGKITHVDTALVHELRQRFGVYWQQLNVVQFFDKIRDCDHLQISRSIWQSMLILERKLVFRLNTVGSWFYLVWHTRQNAFVLLAGICSQFLIIGGHKFHTQCIFRFNHWACYDGCSLLWLNLFKIKRKYFRSFQHIIQLIVLQMLEVSEMVFARLIGRSWVAYLSHLLLLVICTFVYLSKKRNGHLLTRRILPLRRCSIVMLQIEFLANSLEWFINLFFLHIVALIKAK